MNFNFRDDGRQRAASMRPRRSDGVHQTQVSQVKRSAASSSISGNALGGVEKCAAKIDKKEKDLALCGLKDSAEDCEKLAAELGTATRDLLRQRVRQERQLQSLSERASVKREQADAKAVVLKERADIVASMHYRSRGRYRPDAVRVTALSCSSDPKIAFVSSN